MKTIFEDMRPLYRSWLGTENCISELPTKINDCLNSLNWQDIMFIDNHLCDCRADFIMFSAKNSAISSFEKDIVRWVDVPAILHMMEPDEFINLFKKALIKASPVFSNKEKAASYLKNNDVVYRQLPENFKHLIPEYLDALIPTTSEILGVIIPTSKGLGFAINDGCVAFYENNIYG